MMSRWRRELAENLRQRGHHAAFRIEPPIWDEAQRRQLARLLDQLGSVDPTPALDEGALVAVGNGLWQAKAKLGRSTDDPKRTKQVNRHLGNTEKALVSLGLVVQDHTGDRYHSGMSLEVIAMVDDANVAEETVVETIRPSIYLTGRTLQLGQVVVAFPPEKEDPRA